MSDQKYTLLIATGKGLVVYRYAQSVWQLQQVHFKGMPVSVIHRDPRHGTWWVALAHRHWGNKLHYSSDEGKTWKEVPAPKYPPQSEVKPGVPASLQYIWSIQSAGPDQPDVLYLGTEPGGLFRSEDGGKSFELVSSLWEHPSRVRYWFGGGRKHPGIHSIVMDPRDSQHFYIGISCAGVFETQDGGQSWEVRNHGLHADFLPNPLVEVGQDPHRVMIHPQNPDVLWQQNHCGVFLSRDGGQAWADVTDSQEKIRYGFGLALDPEDPEQAWVIPASSDDCRVALDQSLAVFHTQDGGQNWQSYREGLPQGTCFDIVLRHSLLLYGHLMVFGTTTGNLYYSRDKGQSWKAINHHLPSIYALEVY